MDKELEWFRERVQKQEYIITAHARQECIDEDISIADVENSVLNGEIIEDYASRADIRGVCYLINGPKLDSRPVHVVASCSSGKMYIVTVYLPTPTKWIDERTRRTQ